MALEISPNAPDSSSKAASLDTRDGLLCFCPWRWFIGILCLSGLIIVVDDLVGWHTIAAQWADANVSLLTCAIALFILSHFARAQRINELILSGDIKQLAAVTKISSWHQAANNLLPMRMGELALPLLMKRYYGYQWSNGIAGLLWLRLYDAAVMACLTACLIAIARLPLAASLVISTVIVITALLFLTIWSQTLIERLNGFKFASKFCKPLLATRPKRAKTLLALTICAWGLKILAVILAISAVTPVPFWQAISGAIGAELGALLPIHGLAGAGTFEASFVGAVNVFNAITPDIISAAINCHLFMLLTTCTLALLCSVIKTPKYHSA